MRGLLSKLMQLGKMAKSVITAQTCAICSFVKAVLQQNFGNDENPVMESTTIKCNFHWQSDGLT